MNEYLLQRNKVHKTNHLITNVRCVLSQDERISALRTAKNSVISCMQVLSRIDWNKNLKLNIPVENHCEEKL